MPQAKTIKQAKAAFKTRSDNPLTEREQKQLERSLQLDRRAWALREREKNRQDASKKKIAQERAQKDEERRLGTQRRCDKFGFVSSQFHLGAFFRKPNQAPSREAMEKEAGSVADEKLDSKKLSVDWEDVGFGAEDLMDDLDADEDEFEDLDDESLLEALQSPEAMRNHKDTTRAHETAGVQTAEKPPSQWSRAHQDVARPQVAAQMPETSMPPPKLPARQHAASAASTGKPSAEMPPPPRPSIANPQPRPLPSRTKQTDFETDLQDLLDSSAQNESKMPDARMPPPPRSSITNPPPRPPPAANHTNFELDLQDFLESSTQIARDLSHQGPAAPSQPVQPPVAIDTCRTSSFSSGSFDLTEDDIEQLDPTPGAKVGAKADEYMKMPPPPRAFGKVHQDVRLGQPGSSTKPAELPRESREEGFTMTQLESFVEDDLQLTQMG